MSKLFYFNLKDFLVKPRFYLPIFVALLLNVLIWLFLIIKIKPSVNWIPLHYNVYFGIDFLGPWVYIFVYPFLGLLIIFINSFISIKLLILEPILAKILIWSALLVQIIIIMSLFFLALNNF